MDKFMEGFLRALAKPNSAQHIYEAGEALGKWIEDYNKQPERKNPFLSPDRNVFETLDGRPDKFIKDGPRQQAAPQNMQPQWQAPGQDAGYPGRQQGEIEKMRQELHNELLDFINSGNPYPGMRVRDVQADGAQEQRAGEPGAR